nr:hypothetical protein [Lactobacillus helveticus]
MMDSHLNHLMKYLDSVALVITVPVLISGIWGHERRWFNW